MDIFSIKRTLYDNKVKTKLWLRIYKNTQKNSSRFNQNILLNFSRLNSFVSNDTHQWWLTGGELQFKQ